jgi:hypothetical protein
VGTITALLLKNGFSYNIRAEFYYRDSRLFSISHQGQESRVNIKEDTLTFNEILGINKLRVEAMSKGWERVRYHESDGMLADLLRQHGFELHKDQSYYRSPRTKKPD